jgi:hypothetical protein
MMPTDDDIRWFKQQFGAAIQAGIAGTPFSADMMVAIACQETGEIWPVLRKQGLPTARIVELCVGDTIDGSKGRGAFPRTKAELLAAPNGAAMFQIANQALKDMARFIPAYAAAAANPDKFCHGYGIFQYDIQFFKTDPDYFLERRWAEFGQTLAKGISELKDKLVAAKVGGKASLTDMEMAQVAIAYNRGSFDPAKGLKQGYKDSSGRYYGENFAAYLQRAKAIAVPAAAPAPAPPPAPAPAPAGGSGTAAGVTLTVVTQGGPLMLRSAAIRDPANIIGQLGNGQKVQALALAPDNGFLEVNATVGGKALRGFAVANYLKPA